MGVRLSPALRGLCGPGHSHCGAAGGPWRGSLANCPLSPLPPWEPRGSLSSPALRTGQHSGLLHFLSVPTPRL